MINKRILLVFTLIALSCFSLSLRIYAIDARTSISTQDSLYTFTADETMDGFVALRAGFTFDTNGPWVATMKTHVPVSGPITFDSVDGGTIKLARDLYFDSSVTLTNAGTLDGDGYTLHLGGDLTYNNALTCSSDIIIDGHGHHLILGSSSAISVAATKTVTFKNMTIDNLSASRISMAATTSKIIFDNVTLVLDGDYTVPLASGGAIDIKNSCKLTGYADTARKFIFKSPQDFTILANSLFICDVNLTLEHDHASVTDNIVFTDRSSALVLYGGRLSVAQNSLTLLKGTIYADHTAAVSGTITFGDGVSSSNDINLHMLPGTLFDIQANTFTFKDA